MGNDTTEESNLAITRRRKVHGVIKYIEEMFQKYFVPSKRFQSIVVFKSKIISKTDYQKKTTKLGIK
jgi:hypothetical protein